MRKAILLIAALATLTPCYAVQSVNFLNSAFFFSPSTCTVSAGVGVATCDYALWYLKFAVIGTTSVKLTVDTTPQNGATADQMPSVKSVAVAALGTADTAYTLTQFPANNSASTQITALSGLDAGKTYTVTIYGLQSADFGSCYSPGPPCRAVLNSMEIDDAAVLSAAALRPKRCVFFGDSYTLGYYGGAVTGAENTFVDATWSWPFFASAALGCEFSAFGVGSQGYVHTGSGGFPILGGSWNKHITGVTRTFSGIDYVFDAEGLNDHELPGATITTNVTSLLTAQRSAFGTTTKIFVVPPINPKPLGGDAANGSITADITAGVSAAADPLAFMVSLPAEFQNVTFISGLPVTWCSQDGLHLSGGSVTKLDGNCQGLIGYSALRAAVIADASGGGVVTTGSVVMVH